MVDNDSDSAKSDSEEEGDDDFKAKIKAEQARLRSMKVGEDFFWRVTLEYPRQVWRRNF